MTTREIDQARQQWIEAIQEERFRTERALLQAGKRNQLIKQLDLFIANKTIRCGGRMANVNMNDDAKFPVLLPKGHPFTDLVIKDIHQKVFHSGAKATLTRLRLNFWIPQGLTAVKKVLKACLPCRRTQGGTFAPPKMAQLPRERAQQAPAFKFTGLDYL